MVKMKSISRHFSSALVCLLILVQVFDCESRVRTGTVIGGGVILELGILDDAARGEAEKTDPVGKVLTVKNDAGLEINAFCTDEQWIRLYVGSTVEIAPLGGSEYWKVVSIQEGDEPVENLRHLPDIY